MTATTKTATKVHSKLQPWDALVVEAKETAKETISKLEANEKRLTALADAALAKYQML